SNIVTGLDEAGFPDAAADIAREILGTVARDSWEIGECIRTWLGAVGPRHEAAILAGLDQLGFHSVHVRAMAGEAFALNGCLDSAARLTDGLTDTPDANPYEVMPIAKATVLTHGQQAGSFESRGRFQVVSRGLWPGSGDVQVLRRCADG